MSALLDALKKASEKKKQVSQTEHIISEEQGVINSSEERVDAIKLEQKSEPIAVESKVEETPIPFEINMTTVPSEDASQVSSEINELGETVDKQLEVKTKASVETEPLAFDLKPVTESDVTLNTDSTLSGIKQQDDSRDLSSEIPESASSGLPEEMPIKLVPDEPVETVEISEPSIDGVDSLVEQAEAVETPEEKAESPIEDQPVVHAIAESTADSDSSDLTVEVPVKPEKKSSDENSFDWSLDQIPAYANQSTGEKKLNNSEDGKEIFNALNEPLKKNKTTSKSKIFLFILLFLLVGAAIAFYLMLYFQELESNSEASLRQYRLPHPQVQSPSDAIHEATKAISNTTDQKHGVAKPPLEESKKQPVVKPKTLEKKPIVHKVVVHKKVQKRVAVKPKVVKRRVKPTMVRSPKSKTPKFIVSAKPSIEKMAYQAYLNKDYQTAKKGYQKLLAQNPKNISALFGLGAIAMQEGETQKAKQYYLAAAHVAPNNPNVKKVLAVIQASEINAPQYEQHLEQLLLQHPNDGAINYSMGNVYARRNDWLNAQKHYFTAVSSGYVNFDSMMNLAISLDHLGQYAQAKDYYSKAIAMSSRKAQFQQVSMAKKRILLINQFLQKRSRHVQ